MFGVLLYLLFIALVIVIVVLGAGLWLLGKVFGGVENALRMVKRFLGFKVNDGGSRASSSGGFSSGTSGSRSADGYSAEDESPRGSSGSSGGKMFDNDEGEYVEFEEVK